MPSPRQKRRQRAFQQQQGLCFYCQRPMVPATAAGAINRCTAEHLIPKADRGTDAQRNLVAACWFCNHHRHEGRRNARTPAEWATYVRYQVHCGRWPTAFTVAASISSEIDAELRATENPSELISCADGQAEIQHPSPDVRASRALCGDSA
ncbi:HNH endonuclease [Acidovorax sp. 210-6]|nr:HNH endonuclease [Acidovorax sp. 210-6]